MSIFKSLALAMIPAMIASEPIHSPRKSTKAPQSNRVKQNRLKEKRARLARKKNR